MSCYQRPHCRPAFSLYLEFETNVWDRQCGMICCRSKHVAHSCFVEGRHCLNEAMCPSSFDRLAFLQFLVPSVEDRYGWSYYWQVLPSVPCSALGDVIQAKACPVYDSAVFVLSVSLVLCVCVDRGFGKIACTSMYVQLSAL